MEEEQLTAEEFGAKKLAGKDRFLGAAKKVKNVRIFLARDQRRHDDDDDGDDGGGGSDDDRGSYDGKLQQSGSLTQCLNWA
jgi:hypothetical protein